MIGGLIHRISNRELLATRDPKYYTEDEKRYIELLSVDDSTVQPLGSFTFKVQKYPSDIDINQTVKIRHNNFKIMAQNLRNIAIKLIGMKNVFFSDLKLGIDERYPDDKEKFIIRWTPTDLIKGFKILPHNKVLTIEEALQMKSVIKLDIIGFTDNRFIEASTFFVLEKINDDGSTTFVNIPDDFFEKYIGALKDEVYKYTHEPNIKYFKAVKRMWSLARITKDMATLRKLEPMINSNLSLLGQVNADIETLILLVEKTHHLPTNKKPFEEIGKTLNSIGRRISTITDIDIDDPFVIEKLEAARSLIHAYDHGIISELEELHDYILSVINDESIKYMKKHKLYPIDKNYLPHNKGGFALSPILFSKGADRVIKMMKSDTAKSIFKTISDKMLENKKNKGGCNFPATLECPRNVAKRKHEKLYQSVKGKGLATKAFKTAANVYRQLNCDDKARPLLEGELHPKCWNFCGPNTKIELPEVRNHIPYDNIDGVCKQHDIDYYDAKGKPNQAQLIRQADKKMIHDLEPFKNDSGYGLAKAAISGKMTAENILKDLIKSKFESHYGTE